MAQDSIFSKILLNPPSVTFLHTPRRQTASLTITNYSDETVIYKMKSTRPSLFRMSPVYGIIEPRKEVDVRLTYKGLIENEPTQNDRFTVVLAVAPTTESPHSAHRLWEIHKMKDQSKAEISKKKVPIMLAAEHIENTPEDLPIVEDPDDDIIRAPRARIRKKCRGIVEDDVGYTFGKTEVMVPGKAQKKNIPQEDENSYSGEEISRTRSERPASNISSVRRRPRRRSSISRHTRNPNINKSEETFNIETDASPSKKIAKSLKTRLLLAKVL